MPESQRRLWLLRPVSDETGPWNPWYDKAFGFIVRAPDEKTARGIAAANAGDEGEDAWTDPALSRCERLTDDGESGLLMADVHAA